jgi:Zn-dependent protease
VNIRFGRRELVDLAAAWVALGIAFTFFLNRGLAQGLMQGQLPVGTTARTLVLSMATVGVGFLLHELAHKVVAVRFGQVAAFRADYTMLLLAIGAGLAGFLFAAPGAVHHRGRITARENGLIAVAGPITNLLLAAIFAAAFAVGGALEEVGRLGLAINVLLAAFNMLPFGPLDGKKVFAWSKVIFLLVFLVSLGLSAYVLFVVGVGF